MIRLSVEECRWGTDKLENGDGLQLNFLDERSGMMIHIPMNIESLMTLTKSTIEVLNDEQKEEIENEFRTSSQT